VKTYRKYQFQDISKKNNKLYFISVRGSWNRINIDIIGSLPVIEWENKYIVTCIDYMIKWIEAKPLPNKSTKQIV